MLGITFWLAAGIVRFLVAPAFEELPADYANELHVFSKAGFRTSADAKWDESDQKAIRIEQTLASSREVLKIHSNMTWTT
ncbi:MAG: hypothetical protein V4710_11815, partial [Verrucomicrobiota bacterium]